MNRSTLRKQNKAIRRRKSKTIFLPPLVATPLVVDPKPVPIEPTIVGLTPAQKIILDELNKFHALLIHQFQRANCRMLVAGLREGSTPDINTTNH